MSELVAVPKIGLERQIWQPTITLGLTRRERDGGSYRSAIPAALADLDLRLPPSVIADAEEAAFEVSRFDESTRPALGAIVAVLFRSEAASSSQIEQITASARAIAEAELTGSGSGNALLVTDNTQAMTAALDRVDILSADSIEQIQRTLLYRSAPQLVGWRTEPVWIGGAGSTPLTADYVAPSVRHIGEAIDDLVRFAARDNLAILPQVAIAHAQFETIHPFADGNGRTGRAIVQVMLRIKGLTRAATVPISAGLLVEKNQYFEALGAFRQGEAGPIIEQFNRAALRSVELGRRLAARLSDLHGNWTESLKLRADSTAWQVLDLLPAHPVIDAELVASQTGIHRNNVRRVVAPLVEAGILVGRQHYKSHKYLYRSPQVLELLDDYANEAGRRQR